MFCSEIHQTLRLPVLHPNEDKTKNSAIQLRHSSFMDFLTQQDHDCPLRFHIDMQHENTRVAAMCLRMMLDSEHRLKFNICNLDSSHHF
jgi:hypothetical protein